MTDQYVEYLEGDYDNIINDRIEHGWSVVGIIPEGVKGGFMVLYERPDRIPASPVAIRSRRSVVVGKDPVHTDS